LTFPFVILTYVHTLIYSYINILTKYTITMPTKKIMKTTDVMRLLSDPTRLEILTVLFKEQNGICVGEIADKVDISHSATSHHLSKLEVKGIVVCYRDGQTICYELKQSELTQKIQQIIDLFA